MNTESISAFDGLFDQPGGPVRRRRSRLFWFCLPPMLWMLLILLLIGLPGYSVTLPDFSFSDWVIHGSMFFPLGLLWMQALRKQRVLNWARMFAGYCTWMICIVFSGLTELLQAWVFVQRSAQLGDYLANLTGCGLGYLFYVWMIRQ